MVPPDVCEASSHTARALVKLHKFWSFVTITIMAVCEIAFDVLGRLADHL